MRSNSRETYSLLAAQVAAFMVFISGTNDRKRFHLFLTIVYSLTVVRRHEMPSGVRETQNLFPYILRFFGLVLPFANHKSVATYTLVLTNKMSSYETN